MKRKTCCVNSCEWWISSLFEKITFKLKLINQSINLHSLSLSEHMHYYSQNAFIVSLTIDMIFAATNTWFSIFAWICEYSANNANISSANWKMSFEGLVHRFYCFFGYICIALAYKKQQMQLIWLTFEIIDDLDFQEYIHAQAKIPKRPKNGLFRGANTCEYMEMWYLVFGIRTNTK